MAVMTTVTKSKESWSLQLPKLALPWKPLDGKTELEFPRRAMFASVNLSACSGVAPGRDPLEHNTKARPADNCDIARQLGVTVPGEHDREDMEEVAKKKKKGGKKQLVGGLRKVRVKIANPHLRRLVSGAIAGAVSRTFVAPLETIRTHLMVGCIGANSMAGVFQWIMQNEGWTGLFRGNAVNVLRVAPSKAIEVPHPSTLLKYLKFMVIIFVVCLYGGFVQHFTYDTAKKFLTPKTDEPPKVPIPTPLVAGAMAGVASTLCTYPMELIKTRVTIEVNQTEAIFS
jgi:hypothetical protein